MNLLACRRRNARWVLLMRLGLFSVLAAMFLSACARSSSDHLRRAQYLFSKGKNEAAQREGMLAKKAARKERAQAERKYQEATQQQKEDAGGGSGG
jgi:hypothetical protein